MDIHEAYAEFVDLAQTAAFLFDQDKRNEITKALIVTRNTLFPREPVIRPEIVPQPGRPAQHAA